MLLLIKRAIAGGFLRIPIIPAAKDAGLVTRGGQAEGACAACSVSAPSESLLGADGGTVLDSENHRIERNSGAEQNRKERNRREQNGTE